MKIVSTLKRVIDNRRELKSTKRRLEQAELTVGIQGAVAKQPRGDDLNMAQLGAVHEFGSRNIPARPFLRPGVTDKGQRKKAQDIFDKRLNPLEASTVDRALGAVGESIVNFIQERIAKGIEPANAPSTIAQKGSSKPLVDTGRLRQSITWEVK